MTMVMEDHRMDSTVSKSKFKPKALEYFRRVEETGEAIVITDKGRPVLKIVPYRETKANPRARLRGSVLRYVRPTEPVGTADWESLK
jgi:prevent-host-death family protein